MTSIVGTALPVFVGRSFEVFRIKSRYSSTGSNHIEPSNEKVLNVISNVSLVAGAFGAFFMLFW